MSSSDPVPVCPVCDGTNWDFKGKQPPFLKCSSCSKPSHSPSEPELKEKPKRKRRKRKASKTKVCSLILARGGSKGILGKNIVNLNGKELVGYSIEASLASDVDETWVSTDNELISKISKAYGAKVIDRPSELAEDTSKSEEALLHFADNIDFDILVFIQPTSPMILPEDINKAIKLVRPQGKFDSAFTVTKEHWVPRWTASCNEVKPIEWNVSDRPRRQDRDSTYVENGMLYVTTNNQLKDSKIRYGGSIGVVEIPIHRSFQIDSMEDLELIKRIMK
ncbi:acylneuraminate cytidylyltransferase [Candidatus Pacearchaeota archaeon]|nr:acylneuraminate cytidylyltransferase [Candidatus Pacearchaeota archaeon]|tara:strand:+ start:5996 stop:6829 length:834 start_codon:yes stop_codon:yes gene_type:complete